MKLRLFQALNRRRLRRRLKIEAAILDSMKEAEKELQKGIPKQEMRVKAVEAAIDGTLSSSDIARQLDLECKAGLLT